MPELLFDLDGLSDGRINDHSIINLKGRARWRDKSMDTSSTIEIKMEVNDNPAILIEKDWTSSKETKIEHQWILNKGKIRYHDKEANLLKQYYTKGDPVLKKGQNKIVFFADTFYEGKYYVSEKFTFRPYYTASHPYNIELQKIDQKNMLDEDSLTIKASSQEISSYDQSYVKTDMKSYYDLYLSVNGKPYTRIDYMANNEIKKIEIDHKIMVSELDEKENTISLKLKHLDSDFELIKTFKLNKEMVSDKSTRGSIQYGVKIPYGKSKGFFLCIEKASDDFRVDSQVSLDGNLYEDLTKMYKFKRKDGVYKEYFYYEYKTPPKTPIIRIIMERDNTEIVSQINKISGFFI